MCESASDWLPTVTLLPAHGEQPVLLAPVEKPDALKELTAHTALTTTSPMQDVRPTCAAAVALAVWPLGQAAQPTPMPSSSYPVSEYMSTPHTARQALAPVCAGPSLPSVTRPPRQVLQALPSVGTRPSSLY